MYETWSWHTYSYAFGFVLKTGCDRKWVHQARCTQESTQGAHEECTDRRWVRKALEGVWPNQGFRQSPIGPSQTQSSPGVSHRVPYDSSWVYHLISLPEDPPLRGLYKEEESPHSTHHQHVELVLHCKGEVLPRLVLKVGGGWVVRGSARPVGYLLQACTSTDVGFLWYE